MILVKVPALNGLGKTNGCEKAPDEILKALKNIFSNEEKKELNLELLKIREIQYDNSNIELTNQRIYEKSKSMKEKKEKILYIGGDHSITYSLMKGFVEGKENSGIIIFDAHADCCTEFSLPTHEDLLLALVKENIVKPENIIIVGSRNYFKDEVKFLKEYNIKVIDMKQISEQGIKETAYLLMENARKWSDLYVSVDIDAVDPAFAPGTGYIEPAGLTSRQLIYLIQKLNLLKNLKAIDIVEINPEKDINSMTVKLGAKLIAELV